MKKIIVLVMLFVLVLTVTGCVKTNPDNTFNEIIVALKSKDDSKIADMFADTVKSEDDFLQSATEFVNYIRGDIVSFSSLSESEEYNHYTLKIDGKRKEMLLSSFCVNTTENTYYIDMKECIKDDFDNDVGIMSIYIIEANNWTEDGVYRGDEEWTQGINIMDAS